MALKYLISKSDFDDLDESQQGLYKKDGDGYKLDVTGAVPKDKLEEFRSNNIELENKLKAFDGVDLDEVKALKEQQQKLNDKKLIDAGKIDELIQEKLQVVTSDFETKLSNANKTIETLTGQLQERDFKDLIEGAAHKAFTTHSIKPEAQAVMMNDIKSRFIVKDNQAVAMDGDKIVTGQDGNLTIDEYVSTQPEFMKMDSGGGNGREGNRSTPPGNALHGTSKIASGLKKGELGKRATA